MAVLRCHYHHWHHLTLGCKLGIEDSGQHDHDFRVSVGVTCLPEAISVVVKTARIDPTREGTNIAGSDVDSEIRLDRQLAMNITDKAA